MKPSAYLLLLIAAPLFAACAPAEAAAQSAATAAPPVPTAAPAAATLPAATDTSAPTVDPACPVTPLVTDEPPNDPNADAFGLSTWYINAGRTLWAGPQPETWAAGPEGNKTVWIRPAGADLSLSGRRLDGDSEPMRAEIPCCYTTGFQIVGLYFPRAGCWEVTAEAGGTSLQFTLAVH